MTLSRFLRSGRSCWAFGLIATALSLPVVGTAAEPPPAPVRIGSKKFTESVILGEMVELLLQSHGFPAEHQRELGGTEILWHALERGEIDLYPEYTGTLRQVVLRDVEVPDDASLRAELARRGIGMTPSLGFNNTYALGMRSPVATRLGIASFSDLVQHPELRFGFSDEFMNRADGWPGLRDRYGFPQANVRGLDHDLAYRGLEHGDLEVIDLYSTDAEIAYYELTVLRDDRRHFPDYSAVLLYRIAWEVQQPRAADTVRRLAGTLSAETMSKLNAAAKLDRVPEAEVAAGFLRQTFDRAVAVRVETWWSQLLRLTIEHLTLVGISLTAAIGVALPLGVLAGRRPAAGQIILGLAGLLQTIPSLALLVFLIPLLGIGGVPAVVALFLYSLLPILRNTAAGLQDIPPAIRESAEALGLTPWSRLWQIDLPMASRSILAGIKTAAVINIGTATLGALIGAGGYGQPILTGIRLDDTRLILQGAIPAALLALGVQAFFEWAERWCVPAGLRLPATRWVVD